MLLFFQCPLISKEQNRRGLFVTVIQDPQVLFSRQEIVKLIDFSRKARIKILFVQIYRANKSWFPSKTADQTPYETCFKNISEDPFAFLVKEAHKSGIEVHAWLNMLSLSTNKNAVILKKYGSGILTRNLKKKRKIEDYKIDNQYFLEPGDPRVRGELLNVVKEILYSYPELDGIQFDYIRYPDRNPAYGYTKINIERFKKANGNKTIKEESLVWKNWKREQVTGFLAELVRETRRIRPDIQVSATGCAPFVRAYSEAYQDWPSWIKRRIVDFITVMTYADNVRDFKKYIVETKKEAGASLGKVDIAVGAYKFLNSPDIFEEELRICEESGSPACVILGYGDLVKSSRLSDFLIKPHKLSKLSKR
ncbi:MAG: family 10 glycosylhydrolase [Candidatus Omnitrophota bacterium]